MKCFFAMGAFDLFLFGLDFSTAFITKYFRDSQCKFK